MNPFDFAAPTYDTDFTNSVTGKAQRKIIHRYFKKHIKEDSSVLEINCGTGEDAFFLASMGCKVLATDGSAEMIKISLDKAVKKSVGENPAFARKSFDDLKELTFRGPFDLCFSNFSGLNCINPSAIKKLSEDIHPLIKPKGSLILVLFGTKCLWERIYMLVKGRSGDINRRRNRSLFIPTGQNRSGVIDQNPGNGLTIYYYKPGEIKRLLSQNFEYVRSKPIGFSLPPGYLENFFKTKPGFMRLLGFHESISGKFSFLSDWADHYLIEFRRR